MLVRSIARVVFLGALAACGAGALAQDAEQERVFSDQMSRGVAAMEAGDFATAAAAFRTALAAAPGHPEARTFLGAALLEAGDLNGAINQLLPVARDFPQNYRARVALARAYVAAGREGAALPELRAAVDLQPDDHGSRARLTTILMRLGASEEAAGHARHLATALPDNVAVQILHGTAELEVQEFETALAAFDTALRLRSGDVNARYGRAAALRGLGRDREAVQILGAIVEESPEHVDSWILFGDILAGGADIESRIAAVDVYRGGLELRPDDPRLLEPLARLFELAGLDDETIELLADSPALARNEQLTLALARAYFRTEQLDEARALYETATGFGSAEAWYRLGVTEVNLARLDAAEVAYKRALEIEPDLAVALRELGDVQLERGDVDAARLNLDRARAALPDDGRTAYLAGLAALQGGAPDAAVTHLRRAIELDPDDTDALYNLGLALRDSGDMDGGRATLARAQEARRNEPEPDAAQQAQAALRAGYLRYRIGSAASAVSILERATQLQPDEESGWFYLGLSHAELGDHAAAVEALEQAATIRDDRAETWEILTDLYARLGRNDDAARALERFEALRETSGQQ